MSCVVVVAPMVIAAWPAVAASVLAAVGAEGYQKRKSTQRGSLNSVDLELDDVAVEAVGNSSEIDRLVVERDGVEVRFGRDTDGRLRVCVSGSRADRELRTIGQNLAGRIVQHYVHRRLTTRLAAEGFVTIDEERTADAAIHLRVRRWEG